MITKLEIFEKMSSYEIFEGCDSVSLDDGNFIYFNREENITFLYFDGEMKNKPLENSQLYTNFNSESHPFLIKKLKEDTGYSENYIKNHIRFQGRLYLEHKIITFWDYPNKKEFVDIINDLEKIFQEEIYGQDTRIWNDDWKIEIFSKKIKGKRFYHPDYEKFEKSEINNETKLIPIEWYISYNKPKQKYTLQQRLSRYSENIKYQTNDSYKNQIETISKNIVREINETEFDYGKCDQISIEIANAIKNVFNVDCNVLKIDSAKIKGENVWLEHAICVETEHHMVIDTQLWQEFNNNIPDDLDKRKVIFDWEEYNEIVTILDSSLWYTTNEDEENDNEI